MSKLIVELPPSLHEALKRYTFEKGETIRALVTRLIQNTLVSGGKSTRRQETGCCGIWQDGRSAKEIVAEIRGARRWFKTRP